MKVDVVEVGLIFLAVDLTVIGGVVFVNDITDCQAPRVGRLVVSNRHTRVAYEREEPDSQRVNSTGPSPDHLTARNGVK